VSAGFYLFVLLVFCGCSGTGTVTSARSEYVLGTFCRIDLFEEGTSEFYDRLFSRLAELDRILSANRPDSELSALNRRAALEPVPLSPDLYAVLERALEFAADTGGAFDPTVGPLVKLWGIGGDAVRIPADEEIRAALDLVNWRDVELHIPQGAQPDTPQITGAVPPAGQPSVFFRRHGMALDLGAIAKGYAADELAGILQEAGVSRAIIDLGGNIYAWGNRAGPEKSASSAEAKPWRIGVQNPLDERGSYAGILEIYSKSVVTSGVYERYFTGDDGRRYHHILDTLTGYPVDNGILSVTITAGSSMDADALSTACFVLGYEKGLALAQTRGAQIIFVFADKTIRGSEEALAAFTITDEMYRKGEP
jgi:thiamine biosynthesis lipoprotein